MVPQIQQWQSDLIEKVCASEEFKGSESARQILRFLADNSGPENRRLRTEPEMKRRFFSTTTGQLKGVKIPTVISRLQDRLDRFFDVEGMRLEKRIKIVRAEPGRRRPANLYAL